MLQDKVKDWPAWIRIPLLIIFSAIFAVTLLILAIVLVIAFGGHVATAEASATSPGAWYIDPDVDADDPGVVVAPVYADEILAKQGANTQCRAGVVYDRIRSWPSGSTIAGLRGVLRICVRNGTVQSHHFNTSVVDCCDPFWSPDGLLERRTSWKGWRGRPHGSFVGTEQQRFKFCPPVVGCPDRSVLTNRIIGYGNGSFHRNTNIPSI